MNPANSRSRGFTLIELLVVIAIIAILAAILFPVFAQAKEAARKSVCLSGEKQVAMATLLYSNDYDDYACFSLNGLALPDEFEEQSWFADVYYTMPDFDGPFFDSEKGLLWPYMKNQAIYGCPDAAMPLADAGVSPLFPNGHGVNANVMVFELTAWGVDAVPTVSLTSVDRPAETILIADSVYVNDSAPFLTYQTWIQSPSEVGPETWGIHNKFSNVAFVDGHAKAAHITPDTNVGDYNNDAVWMANALKYNVGSILNPKYPYGSDWVDYYYRIDKPN